jgi:glycosyltransferase involved in cell wall biosynthesis
VEWPDSTPTGKGALDRVLGIVVTYRRPAQLARALAAIADQTLRVSDLIVVDNGGSDSHTLAVVDSFRGRGLRIDLIAADSNTGPAGGRAIGMRAALSKTADHDWLALFDDDDALPTPTTLEALVHFAQERRACDSRLGGVGLRGARFEWKHVRTVAVADLELTNGPARVDHLHGGFFPVYAVSAVRDVGTFRADLFFGFEELEYGLRMTGAGHSLFVDGTLWQECAPHLVRREQRRVPRFGLDEPRWERYYKLRNLLRIVIEGGHGLRAARIAAIRGIAKPIANVPLRPRPALVHLQLGVRAIRDAWGGRLGAIPGADPRDVARGRHP